MADRDDAPEQMILSRGEWNKIIAALLWTGEHDPDPQSAAQMTALGNKIQKRRAMAVLDQELDRGFPE